MSDAQEEKAPQDATDPELLNKIHAALIMILRELDAACEQLGISYVVCGGTAIGAARHKGFIPWDDDVDVYMPRGDYERFLAEAPAILPPEFEVLSSRSHPDYPKTFGILGLVGSTFTPQVARNRKFPIPIGIDLFPLDPIPEDPSAFSRQARSTRSICPSPSSSSPAPSCTWSTGGCAPPASSRSPSRSAGSAPPAATRGADRRDWGTSRPGIPRAGRPRWTSCSPPSASPSRTSPS